MDVICHNFSSKCFFWCVRVCVVRVGVQIFYSTTNCCSTFNFLVCVCVCLYVCASWLCATLSAKYLNYNFDIVLPKKRFIKEMYVQFE